VSLIGWLALSIALVAIGVLALIIALVLIVVALIRNRRRPGER
jgi:uncharacterized membrane protein